MSERHRGRHEYRFADHPAERIFAGAWQREHERGLLDYLLAEDNNRPCGEVTDRDAEVAATVAQWLGSPVGLAWVRSVLARIAEEEPRA